MKSRFPLKRWLSIVVMSAVGLATPASAAPVLIGSATLNLADDLTVIRDGSQVLQFLDLTSTQGMTIVDAFATFGGSGFHWATGAEVAQLYAAFGFAYESAVNGHAILNVSAANATTFTSHLGTTFNDAALGWIDDNTDTIFHTYSCISVLACQSNAFVFRTADFWPAFQFFGVYMVRDAPRSVPAPDTTVLIGIGLAGILALRRRSGKVY